MIGGTGETVSYQPILAHNRHISGNSVDLADDSRLETPRMGLPDVRHARGNAGARRRECAPFVENEAFSAVR